MKEVIKDIKKNILAGCFANEASVSQGIVQRILSTLGWPVYNPQIVYPEYSVEGRRVDFALCHPQGRPKIFIEVKQIGNSDGADRQLFEYAFHLGVPMAILTDGNEWQFFLPSEQGSYSERRLYKLNLLERDPEEAAARFMKYLKYDAVCSGLALDEARKEYRDAARRKEISKSLPAAWNRLIEEGDDLLIELISNAAEDICGYKPDADSVLEFLNEGLAVKERLQPVSPLQNKVSRPLQSVNKPKQQSIQVEEVRNATYSFTFLGQPHSARNLKDMLVKVIQEFAKHDNRFLEKYNALPKHGKTRRFIAKTKEELYPGRQDLANECSEQILPGWYLGTNVGRQQAEKIIRLACEVSGLKFGIDIKLMV